MEFILFMVWILFWIYLIGIVLDEPNNDDTILPFDEIEE